jgi:hypothetical protein
VLRNISGPVNIPVQKHRAGVPLHGSRRVTDKDESSALAECLQEDEYQFLAAKSSPRKKVIAFNDLESAAVSNLVYDGAVFWSPEVSSLEEANLEEDLSEQSIPVTHHQNGFLPMSEEAVGGEQGAVVPVVEEDQPPNDGAHEQGWKVLPAASPTGSEEKTVEMMLGF